MTCYEAKSTSALNPKLRQNRQVVDLELAATDSDGLVRFFADLTILTPSDPTKSSGAVLYDVNNRGNMRSLDFFNDARGGNSLDTSAHAGNGFLMEHGWTVISSGWDGELLAGTSRLKLYPPTLGPDVKGLVRYEFTLGSGKEFGGLLEQGMVRSNTTITILVRRHLPNDLTLAVHGLSFLVINGLRKSRKQQIRWEEIKSTLIFI